MPPKRRVTSRTESSAIGATTLNGRRIRLQRDESGYNDFDDAQGLLAVAVLGALLSASGPCPRRACSRARPRIAPTRCRGRRSICVRRTQDGSDRALDTNGAIDASAASWQRWLRGQTGGRGLRLDTFQGDLDVSFFRLAATDAVVASRGAFVRDAVAAELLSAGFNSPDKIYAVYYDGSSTFSCGGAGPPPTTQGSVTVIYLRGTPPGSPPCASNPIGTDPPSYFDFAMLHEIVHTMGFVPRCAPHVTFQDHVSDSRFDLMWSGNEPWESSSPPRCSSTSAATTTSGYGSPAASTCPGAASSRAAASGWRSRSPARRRPP